jgi:hypothetical protein
MEIYIYLILTLFGLIFRRTSETYLILTLFGLIFRRTSEN